MGHSNDKGIPDFRKLKNRCWEIGSLSEVRISNYGASQGSALSATRFMFAIVGIHNCINKNVKASCP